MSIYVYVSNHCHASLCESEFPQLTVHRNNKMNIYMIHKHMCQSDIFLIEVILTLSEYLYDTQICVKVIYFY